MTAKIDEKVAITEKVTKFLKSWEIPANPEQVDFISSVHDKDNAVGEAVPGSGKTMCVVAMAHYLIYSLRIPREDILIMSFNTDAAELVRNRMAKLCAGSPMHFRTVSRTYHSVGFEVCRALGRQNMVPSPMDMAVQAYNEYVERYGKIGMDAKEILTSVSFLKNKGAYVPPGSSTMVVPENAFEEIGSDETTLTRLFMLYERAKGDMVDFDDQILIPCNHYRASLQGMGVNPFKLFSRIKYLFLDELQDANASQMLMAQAISDVSGCKIVGVGDKNQAIYSWRGASTGNIETFVKNFNATHFHIPRNYRSAPEILNAASTIIRRKPGRESYDLIAGRKDITGQLHEVMCSGTYDQNNALVQIVTHLSQHYQPRQIYILARTNAAISAAARTLFMANIPVSARLDDFQNEYCQVNNAVAAMANHPNASLRDTLKFIRFVGEKRAIAATQEGCDLDSVKPGLVGKGRIGKRVGDFIEGLKAFREEIGAENILTDPMCFKKATLVVRDFLLGFIKEYSGITRMTMETELETVVQAMIEMSASMGPKECIDRLYEFDDIDISAKRNNCIEMMTTHKAKGQENDCVIIIDGDNYPCVQVSESSEQYDQEINLLFVAITRAKERLIVMRYPKWAPPPSSGEIISPLYEKIKWTAKIDTSTKAFADTFPVSQNGPTWNAPVVESVAEDKKIIQWPDAIKEFEMSDDFEKFKGDLYQKIANDGLSVYLCQPNNDWNNPEKFNGIYAELLGETLSEGSGAHLSKIYNAFMSKSIKPEDIRLKSHHTWLRIASSLLANKMGNGWTPCIFSKRQWLRSILVQKDWIVKVSPGNISRPSTETCVCISLCLSITGHPRVRPELQVKISHVRFSLNQSAASVTNLMRYDLIPTHGLLPMIIWQDERDYGKSMKAGEGFHSAVANILASPSFMDIVERATSDIESNFDELAGMAPRNIPVGGHVWSHVETDVLWPLHPSNIILVENVSGRIKDFFDPASAFKDKELYDSIRVRQSICDRVDNKTVAKHAEMIIGSYQYLQSMAKEALVARLFNVPSSMVSSEASGKRTTYVIESMPQITFPENDVEEAFAQATHTPVKFKIM